MKVRATHFRVTADITQAADGTWSYSYPFYHFTCSRGGYATFEDAVRNFNAELNTI